MLRRDDRGMVGRIRDGRAEVARIGLLMGCVGESVIRLNQRKSLDYEDDKEMSGCVTGLFIDRMFSLEAARQYGK